MSTDKEQVTLVTSTGVKWTMYEGDDGGVVILCGGHHNILVDAGAATNVVRLVGWPMYDPVVPPTVEHPVRVSRDIVMDQVKPEGNGVSGEATEAVQAAVDADTLFEKVIRYHIDATLEGAVIGGLRHREGARAVTSNSAYEYDEYGVFLDRRADGLGMTLVQTYRSMDSVKLWLADSKIPVIVRVRTVTKSEWREVPDG